ncbi:MAG: glycoside hydrolase family 3 N-terminal domain-containing protein [Candidatus Nanopelagicales bacterium]
MPSAVRPGRRPSTARALPAVLVLALGLTLTTAACSGSEDAAAPSGPGGTPTPVDDGAPGASTVASGETTAAAESATASVAESATPTRTCPAAASLPLRQRLQQTLMVWADGSAGSVPGVLTNPDVLIGGVFVGGNDTAGLEAGEFAALAERPVPPLVAVDDEGGQVQRIDGVVGDMPSAEDQADGMTPAEVRGMARDRGRALAELGITVDLAPVVDLNDGDSGGVIGDRAYSDDPDVVVDYAGAFARGLQQAGILPTLKHFPGHGRAQGDSHQTLPTTPPWASVQAQDLLPYEALLDRPGPWAVMVGHLVVPGLTTEGRPASLDPAVYRYLREDLGFDGLVMTDELSGMKAVSASYGPADAAAAALAAGADLLLMAAPGDLTELLDRLETQVIAGELSEQRVTDAADHVLAAKTCRP